MDQRALTKQEAAVIEWLLDHAAMADVSAFRAIPPGELVVTGGCGCGCRSLNFAPECEGMAIVARAVATYPDGQRARLRLWGHDGKIVSLEMIDYDPALAHPFPEVGTLAPYRPSSEPAGSSR